MYPARSSDRWSRGQIFSGLPFQLCIVHKIRDKSPVADFPPRCRTPYSVGSRIEVLSVLSLASSHKAGKHFADRKEHGVLTPPRRSSRNASLYQAIRPPESTRDRYFQRRISRLGFCCLRPVQS